MSTAKKAAPAVPPDAALDEAADAVAALRAQLVVDAKAFAKRALIKLSTVSLYIMGDGKGLARIEAGGDIQTKQLERAYRELAKRTRGLYANHDPAKLKQAAKAKTRR